MVTYYRYCKNEKHTYYQVNEMDIPKDEKCPICGKFLDNIKTEYGRENRIGLPTKKIVLQPKDIDKEVDIAEETSKVYEERELVRETIDKKNIEHIQETNLINEVFKKLNIYGMEEIKKILTMLYIELDLKRTRELLQESINMSTTLESKHFMILGNEKSGKTILVKAISTILCETGVRSNEKVEIIKIRKLYETLRKEGVEGSIKLLSKFENQVVIIEGNVDELVMQLSGNTGIDNTLVIGLYELMEEYSGKITFLWEASIEQGNNIFSANIKIKDVCCKIIMENYNPKILVEIAGKIYKEEYGYIMSKDAKEELRKRIKRTYFEKIYSQGRFLNDIFCEAKEKYLERISCNRQNKNYEKEEIALFDKADFKEAVLDEKLLQNLLKELNSMIGLKEVKENINKMVGMALFNRKRLEEGNLPLELEYMNMLFLGGPGTGKTTIVKLVAKIYKCLGFLKTDSVVIVSKEGLESQYVGDSTQKTQLRINEAIGGTLFIDEAYSLVNQNMGTSSNGTDIINTIVNNLGIHKRDLLVIMAGYENDMDKLMKTNEGLSRRFPNKIFFADFTVDEMTTIFINKAEEKGLVISKECRALVSQLIEEKSKSKDFGNAGGVVNLLGDIEKNMTGRLLSEESNNGSQIIEEDITCFIKEEKEKTLEELREELNSMIGLKSAKKKVSAMESTKEVEKILENRGIRGEKVERLNLIFKGNSGTGKTTVARIIGKMYAKMGVLKYGDVFVECRGRGDLVAGYQGQTALKVKEVLKRAQGGVLFIDEAYSLKIGEKDTFGQEAIDTLCAEIDNSKETTMVIVAGYADQMDRFIDANPGIASRFAEDIIFEDYLIDDLLLIFKKWIEKYRMMLPQELETVARKEIEKKRKKKNFGNGRDMKTYAEKVYEKRNVRIQNICRNEKNIENDEIQRIKVEDLLTGEELE